MAAYLARRSFEYGLLLTCGATAASWAIAFWGFNNMYYMAQLLPVFMTLNLLLAWLTHISRTSQFAARRLQRKDAIQHRETGLAADLPEDKASGAEISDLRDQNGLVRRRPVAPRDTAATPVNATAVLAWSALQLAALATALYWCRGIGARFF